MLGYDLTAVLAQRLLTYPNHFIIDKVCCEGRMFEYDLTAYWQSGYLHTPITVSLTKSVVKEGCSYATLYLILVFFKTNTVSLHYLHRTIIVVLTESFVKEECSDMTSQRYWHSPYLHTPITVSLTKYWE